MIATTSALQLASEWLELPLERVGSLEFALGWVVWELPGGDDEDEEDVLTLVVGSARGVVDRDTGHVTGWPCLPASVVAEMYEAEHAARGRFDTDVAAVLEAAGWYPGRSLGDVATVWLAEAASSLGIRPEAIHPAARALIDEFGGLLVTGRAAAGPTLRLFPVAHGAVDPNSESYDDPAQDVGALTGRDACPVGLLSTSTGLYDVLLARDGVVLTVSGPHIRVLGRSVDTALAHVVRGTHDDDPGVDGEHDGSDHQGIESEEDH